MMASVSIGRPKTRDAKSHMSAAASAPEPSVADVATGTAAPRGRSPSAIPRVRPRRRSSMATSVP